VTTLTSRRLVLQGLCAKCGAKLRISVTPGKVSRIVANLGEDVDVWCTACNKKTALRLTDDNRHFLGIEPTEQDLVDEAAEVLADTGPGF
jgi:hypothetical protein